MHLFKEMAEGKSLNLNLYFAGKNAIADFKAEQDLVISLYDVMNGRPSFGLSKGGGEIPWYVFELPVVGISVNAPTMLADVPMLRTYINAYDSKDDTMDALVEALLTGPDAFKGNVADISGFLRLAVTGKLNAPDLYTVMQLLGKDRVFARLDKFEA